MSNKFAMSIMPIAFFAHADSSVSLGEISISSDSRFSEPISTVLAPVSVLTRDEIEELGATSLVDALKTLPSIEIGQNGGRGQLASIFMRGTNSNHVLVLVDGVRLPVAMLGTPDFNMLPLNTIERIEVIRGTGATVYGSDAIGGVINIITRSDKNDRRLSFGLGSMNTYSANFGSTEILSDKLTLQVMGGYETTDGYNVRPDIAPCEDEHGFNGKNLSARLRFQSSENWQANVFGRWYQNEVGYADTFMNLGAKAYNWIDNKSIGSDFSYQFSDWQHLLRIEYSEQKKYDYSAVQSRNDETLNYQISQFFASFASRLQLIDELVLTVGTDLSLEKYLDGSVLNSSTFVDNPRRNVGIYGIANWQWLDNWQFEASARFDDNQQYGDHTIGQIALGWNINENYRAHVSTGTAFKAPSLTHLYHPFGGNTNLKPEESMNYEFGIESFYQYLDWSINAYQNDVDNLILWFNGKNENIAKAQIRGLELATAFDVGLFYNRFSLEFRDPFDKKTNEQLVRRAKTLAKWQSTVRLNKWLLGLQYNYQGKRPDFDAITFARINASSYSVWDFTAQYAFSDYAVLRGKIANAFNKDYSTVDGYFAPERAYYLNVDFTF